MAQRFQVPCEECSGLHSCGFVSLAGHDAAMIVDLFAGPGGWDVGLAMLGFAAVGIEWDADACATARAAGHQRICADVAESPVSENVVGLIASPPCQGFSQAGKGLGRGDRHHIMQAAIELAAGTDTRKTRGELCADHRSMLTVEPLRWALEANPEWIAFEQVPAVLPLWELFADILRFRGYSVDTGHLSAEQFGVPQTRKRAYLVASRTREAKLPRPTHQKYRKGEPAQMSMDGLLPWVSMREALGWGLVTRPAYTIPAANTSGGGPRPLDGGSGARRMMAEAQRRGEWVQKGDHTGSPWTTPMTPEEIGMLQGFPPWQVQFRQNARSNATVRRSDEPAPTITGGHDFAERMWSMRSSLSPKGYDKSKPRTLDEPAQTITSKHRSAEWSQEEEVRRVTVEEAAIFQGFPAVYPWQGSRTKQFEQIGNAVCPPVAAAVLAEAMGLEVAIAA